MNQAAVQTLKSGKKYLKSELLPARFLHRKKVAQVKYRISGKAGRIIDDG